ncbi:MAG: ATP synthase subunit B/B', partial [Actinobacteria bacterium]|nr:ATP synthase subunit B/B' [Actinomycetota bacterium]
MESIEKLTVAITMVEEARGVPLSASCVVHRDDLLELLDEARNLLPHDFSTAQNLLSARDSIMEEGQSSAEQLIALAREEVSRMVEQTA